MCLGRSPDRRRHSVPAVLVCGNRFRLGHDPLPVGQWAQATQPFKNAAGQAVMNRGHAKITVQTGSGVFGFASVIDNITNDPTTVAMQR